MRSTFLLLMEQGKLQNIIQRQAQTWPSIFSLIHTEMSWPKGTGGCHQLIFFLCPKALKELLHVLQGHLCYRAGRLWEIHQPVERSVIPQD